MTHTLSLNGAENVGKTTQLELLPSHYTISKVSGLPDSDKKIGEMYRQGLLQKWWWESSNEEFTCSIFGALGRRHWDSIANEHSVITVFDRGISMFEAVVVAVIAVKSADHDLCKARTVLDTILEKYHLQVPKERLAILLRHGDSLEESVLITMSREGDPGDQRYRLYQLLLQSELERQEQSGVYQHVIKVGATTSIGDVQDELREVILCYTQNQLFLPVFHNIQYIYALSGLSESGKSSVAEAFCSHYGPEQAFRAKIVYFNNVISERFGKSVYDLPEKEQALLLFHELERFSNGHYWLRIITIESMHRYSAAKWLKTWIGRKVQVIYIDAADVKRFERALVSREAVISNDELKRERGVELIRSDADLVLDNNGIFAVTMSNLLRFAKDIDIKC